MVKFEENLLISKSDYPIKFSKPTTLLTKKLTSKQQIYSNYLIPYIFTSIIYILNFAADFCLALQHLRDENNLEASLTLFFTYLPAIGCIFFTLSDYDLWPEETGFGCQNIRWLTIKLLEHLFYPVWAMYRFAEQLFWSIEALRTNDNKEITEYLEKSERNSVFELYHFLQAYVQAAPQILYQLHMIFRQTSKFNTNTVNMQVFCIVMSLIKMALTTSSYQRFKSQKQAGRKYPWKKISMNIHTLQESYKSLGSGINLKEITEEDENVPTTSSNKENINSDEEQDSATEADQNQIVSRKNSGLSMTSSEFNAKFKKQEEEVNRFNNFMVTREVIKYRPADDAAGKFISFLWWFCFIIPRMLTLTAFAYFYTYEIYWICTTHYIICLAFLLYDAHTNDIPYYRAIFTLFTAYIYMFCLIEFKIKFKKINFIYNGYFILVYLENFVMTFIWYFNINFDQDWWYKYLFYVITISSLFSVLSMILYLFVLKPKKITVFKEIPNSKNL